MTRVGKILVMLNVALSLAMAGFAIGVFRRNIEWSIDTNKNAQVTVDQLEQLKDRLVPGAGKPRFGLWDDIASAEHQWKFPEPDPTVQQQMDAYTRLQKFEATRPVNQKWFDQQLAELEKSKDPLTRPSYKNGKLEFNPRAFGQPVMVEAQDKGGQPIARGLNAYRLEYNDRAASIKAVMEDLDKWIKEDIDLTVKIAGKGGLRELLAREADKKQRVLAEQDFLKPLLVNSAVESELLFKRQADLEARVKELQSVGVAASR
jgi:hypothetical protein